MSDNHLELGGCEETTGACVLAAAEVQMVFVGHCELVPVLLVGLLAEVVVAKAIKVFRVGNVLGIL